MNILVYFKNERHERIEEIESISINKGYSSEKTLSIDQFNEFTIAEGNYISFISKKEILTINSNDVLYIKFSK